MHTHVPTCTQMQMTLCAHTSTPVHFLTQFWYCREVLTRKGGGHVLEAALQSQRPQCRCHVGRYLQGRAENSQRSPVSSIPPLLLQLLASWTKVGVLCKSLLETARELQLAVCFS